MKAPPTKEEPRPGGYRDGFNDIESNKEKFHVFYTAPHLR
jgi:hypothetical protein